jgi:hypothetical protein
MKILTDAIVKKALVTNTTKKVFQTAEDLVYHFFVVGHFRDRCLKFKYKMKAVMVPDKVMTH